MVAANLCRIYNHRYNTNTLHLAVLYCEFYNIEVPIFQGLEQSFKIAKEKNFSQHLSLGLYIKL